MSASAECSTCKKLKAALTCGVCAADLCKACAQFADEESVALLEPIPAHYTHGVFCASCYNNQIQSEIQNYETLLAQAKEVDVFYKSQGKESRFIRRTEKPLRVADCVDRDLAILKLAFQAAQQGFNILLDVEIASEKVRLAGWQTSKWHGVGIPGLIDQEKLKRRFVGAPN